MLDYKVVSGKCSTNEQLSTCGSDCGHTCNDVFAKGFPFPNGTSPAKCPKTCTRGCFCETGYVRDFNQKGRCVRPYECKTLSIIVVSIKNHTIECQSNQVYKCGSDCGKYCEDLGKDVKCRDTCDSGCYCMDGYYRDSRINGQCVKEKYCKKRKQKKFNSKKREFVQWFKNHFPWKKP